MASVRAGAVVVLAGMGFLLACREDPLGLRWAGDVRHAVTAGEWAVVVDPATRPEAWPRDPFRMGSAEIRGDVLEVAVSYSGGCRPHTFRAVAWGGWMESHPVQLRVFLSHDASGDSCEALVSRTLRFDLGPVKRAYRAAYGIAEAGKTTLVLLLDDPLLMNPFGARRLEYVF